MTHNFFCFPALLVPIILLVGMSHAAAELTFRYAPEPEDSGATKQPAKFGYSNSTKGEGSVATFALKYNFKEQDIISKESSPAGEFKKKLGYWIPYVALAVDDDDSRKKDSKSLEAGFEGSYGQLGKWPSWLLSGSASASEDRIEDTKSIDLSLNAQMLQGKLLNHGAAYTKGKWGLFIFPVFGSYYNRTIETSDAVKEPKGYIWGASATLGFDIFLPFNDRTLINYKGTYAHDFDVGGDRKKDEYDKHKVNVQYFFYNPLAESKEEIKPKYSIGASYTSGRDAKVTSQANNESVSVYLGILF